jgi:hypothetical protein
MKIDMKNTIKSALLAFILLFSWNCTDLEEQILDESLSGGASESDLVRKQCGACLCLAARFFPAHEIFCCSANFKLMKQFFPIAVDATGAIMVFILNCTNTLTHHPTEIFAIAGMDLQP